MRSGVPTGVRTRLPPRSLPSPPSVPARYAGIVRRTRCSLQTVPYLLHGERDDVCRVRASSLEPWLGSSTKPGRRTPQRRLALALAPPCRLRRQPACRHQVGHAPSAYRGRRRRCPSACKIAMMLTRKRAHLTREDAVSVAIIEAAVPVLAIVRQPPGRVPAMIRKRGLGRIRFLGRRRIVRTVGIVRLAGC